MKYSASYTAGGLLFDEVETLYPILIEENWQQMLRQDIITNQYFKINSEAARKRLTTEFILRFKNTNFTFWKEYETHNNSDKMAMLFYNCLCSYKIIYDFHFTVTIPRFISLDTKLDNYWYEIRLQTIASVEPEVDKWAISTKTKIITRYVGMLKKCGMLVNGILIKPELNPSLLCYFIKENNFWALDAFLLKVHEKENIINLCNDN